MRISLGFALLAAPLAFAACGDSGTGTGVPDGGFNYDALMGGLIVTPMETTIDITTGMSGQATFTATTADGNDVTTKSAWADDDTSLGTMSGATFTSNTTKGGTTLVHAVYNGLTGAATVHVKLHSTVTTNCPGCPAFPDMGAMSCGAGTDPMLVYPPDGVLIPPNMNVLQVQFMPGTGTMFYEVDFENAAIDVRVETKCNPITDTRMAATGGCSYDLDQQVWDLIAQANRGGDPVTVTVRATTDGSCATGSNSRSIAFAQEDLRGGIYYWQSIVVGAVAGKAGGIFRYDFGSRGATSQPYLTPATGRCVGCHFLSRDGVHMTYSDDDADSDDEYGDMQGHLLDVASKAIINTSSPSGKPLPPGFQTFTHDHTLLLGSDGQNGASRSFLEWNGDTGGSVIGMPSTGQVRGTQPDWSADDASVVYVAPAKFAQQFNPNPYSRADDDHFIGGSLFTLSYSNGTFGAPQALVTSAGENNYYPSFSPDTPASFVIFNRVSDASLTTDLSKDCFNNPYARVFILSTKQGAMPIDAGRLNDTGPLTNSWPRWSPFIQMYKGQKLLWVTFSSTRDYGLKVRNHDKVPDGLGNMVDQINCFPPDSPQNLNGSHQQPLPPNCNQPQIWMAAINLSQAEFGNGTDPSFPAFWLPFQEVTAHNHIAQWVQEVVGIPTCDGGMGGQDGGMCIPDGSPCGGQVCGVCCGSDVCSNGACTSIVM
jgi:hypothetical protein